MRTIIHRSDTRGHANHGWLNSYHSFSFAGYYNPEKMSFGALRVLNDDAVAGGQGFGTHRHDNMEIISIPLEGDLEHKDSMGNTTVIRKGDVQVMSAGTGISHSEYNFNPDSEVKFLQIWVIPNQQQVTPRYGQISIEKIAKPDQLFQILSPNEEDEGVWIHQNAWFSMGSFDMEKSEKYQLNDSQSGVYLFVLEGQCNIGEETLNHRDAIGLWETSEIDIAVKPGCRLLLMEVPMKF